jgi:membrane-bound inhibitor of C-type lysozyme
VASDVDMLAAGGGAVAYVKRGNIFVLLASEQAPVQIGTSQERSGQPLQIGVDEHFVGYANRGDVVRTPDSSTGLTIINYRTGENAKLGQAYWTSGPQLSAGRAFWWSSGNPTEGDTLWSAAADGTTTPAALVEAQSGGALLASGNTVAWTGHDRTLWTLRADQDAPPQKHSNMPDGRLVLDGSTVYAGLADRIVAVSLDGAEEQTIATMLSPNYPSTGTESPRGNAIAVVGAKRIFWAECWGNGGAAPNGRGDALFNWVLRAVSPTGGQPEVIDMFTWDEHAATFGSCPEIAADSAGVYWTHEGTLMRLCE